MGNVANLDWIFRLGRNGDFLLMRTEEHVAHKSLRIESGGGGQVLDSINFVSGRGF